MLYVYFLALILHIFFNIKCIWFSIFTSIFKFHLLKSQAPDILKCLNVFKNLNGKNPLYQIIKFFFHEEKSLKCQVSLWLKCSKFIKRCMWGWFSADSCKNLMNIMSSVHFQISPLINWFYNHWLIKKNWT